MSISNRIRTAVLILLSFGIENCASKQRVSSLITHVNDSSWIADGMIALTHCPDANLPVNCATGLKELELFDLKKQQFLRLTHDNFDDEFPSWSPTGSRIVFSSNRPFSGQSAETAPRGIYIYDIGKGEITSLTEPLAKQIKEYEILDLRLPKWSPLLNRIAFIIKPFPVAPSKLAVFDLDKDSLRILGTIPDPVETYWTPTGRYIVFDGLAENSDSPSSLNRATGFYDFELNTFHDLNLGNAYRTSIIGCFPNSDRLLVAVGESKGYTELVLTKLDLYAGKLATIGSVSADYEINSFGRDSTELVLSRVLSGHEDLWLFNLGTRETTRLTDDGRSKSGVTVYRRRAP